MDVCLHPFAGLVSPLDSPVVTSVEYQTSTNFLTTTFSQPLVAGPGDAGDWVACIAGAVTTWGTCNVTMPGTICFGVAFGGFCGAPDRVSFTNASGTVVGTNGQPAQPFTDYPVTVVP